MSITRTIIKDRAHWLSMREQDVTASAAGALLGVHDYMTPLQLALEKNGRGEVVEETPPMRRGKRMEPVAIAILREEHPELTFEVPNFYVRDTEARLGATPDLLATCPERGPGIVQIKSVEASIFRMKWVERESREQTPPLWIVVQAIVEAHLTGAKWAAVAPMVVSHGIDVPLIEIPIHEGVIERVKEATADFWAKLSVGELPSPDFSRDGETLARLYADDNGQQTDLTGDNRIIELLDRREELSALTKHADLELQEIRAEIIAKLGDNASAIVPGWSLTAKTQHRKAYSVKASSSRVVRVKRLGEKVSADVASISSF